MTTLQTGDEDNAVENATEGSSSDETLENSGEEPVDHSSDKTLENSGEESVEHSSNEAVEEMDRLSLPPPRPFNIEASDLYSEWTHWLSSFEIYAVASDLQKKSDAAQRATMLHRLGPTVQRIFSTLPGENTTLAATKDALNGSFSPKRNVVAERYKFRSRAQQPEESIDAYLTALRELAKSCDFAALEEEMIRDQIVERCHSKSLKQPGPPKDDETRTKRRGRRAGDTFTVEGQPRRPNKD